MSAIQIPAEYGYVLAVAVALWAQQSIIFTIPVALARGSTGIKPPVLYPNDKLIEDLKLKKSQVDSYMCAQRVHQNNMEFLTVYFPMYLLSSLENPVHAAAAGGLVVAGRMVTALGYWKGASHRIYGAW